MLGEPILPSGPGDLVIHPKGGILYAGASDGSIRVLDYNLRVLQVRYITIKLSI